MKDIRVGNKVRQVRVNIGLTQGELADLVGVTRQTIGLIEVGRYNPSLKLCLLIAEVTSTSISELFWKEKDDE